MLYAIDNICGGACKAISNFNRSLGSRCYFVRIVNERTSAASFACAFKSTWLIIRLVRIGFFLVPYEGFNCVCSLLQDVLSDLFDRLFLQKEVGFTSFARRSVLFQHYFFPLSLKLKSLDGFYIRKGGAFP